MCVSGSKKCYFFGKFCVSTKWMIPNPSQYFEAKIEWIHVLEIQFRFVKYIAVTTLTRENFEQLFILVQTIHAITVCRCNKPLQKVFERVWNCMYLFKLYIKYFVTAKKLDQFLQQNKENSDEFMGWRLIYVALLTKSSEMRDCSRSF